jgi:predicted dehydrogenase/aryl-alcohol dehydrogenase-like predicted oxidoreductase
MAEKLGWGILGTGAIAKAFAQGVAQSKTGTLVAVGSRSQESADKFAEQFNIPHRHASYQALLDDEKVNAIYIALPHPMHAEWAVKGAAAKKHLLVEKPIGLNHAEAMAIVEAARENDVFLMEAFMYRCHPQTQRLVELIRDKTIGDVRVIQATFSFHWPIPFNDTSRLTNNALGGGGILDVGCYPASMCRLIAGVANGKPFAEPIEFKAVGELGPSGVDHYTVASAKFPGGIVAQLSTGVQVNQDNALRIYGTDGWIHVAQPWVPARDGGTVTITLHKRGEKSPTQINIETSQQIYGIEADTVATFLDKRQASSPAMSWDDTLGNMKTLDAWRAQIGLQYESEKMDAVIPTISRKPLSRKAAGKMKYGKIAGVEKQVSRLVMGVDNQTTLAHASVMFDDYFERGGNTFDTAYIYGGGLQEKLLGRWIKNRNLRDEVVVICKGAHTPANNPKDLTTQLITSLERMQIEHADIYMMHRDNLDIPVGEFIDVLNEHKKAGRIHAFGGSNWSLKRVAEANEYAKSKGLTGFSVVSNNFSLARMVDPVWAGCIAASDAESRAWLKEHQVALLAWSSQARGFFLPGKAKPDDRSDAELSRCWYSEDNFQRLARVNDLATKKNVLPINIALAYVLSQPFPTFPLIGPRTLYELHTSLPALDVELSEDEMKWLNLENEQ